MLNIHGFCNRTTYGGGILNTNISSSSSTSVVSSISSRSSCRACSSSCRACSSNSGLSLSLSLATVAVIAAASTAAMSSLAAEIDTETLSNVPQTLSGECVFLTDCKKAKIQRPKSTKAESCTIKCVATCIRGGQGSPGEGPLNVRRPLVVFKQGFRSRRYCLVECSDICNLIGDGDDGP